MSVVTVEGASHWYDPSGVPVHEVLRADGEGYRPTTLADARKLGLYPSVTNVLSVLRKPYLDAWRTEQYLQALLDVYNSLDYTTADRLPAAVDLAEQRMAEPRDLGSTYHQVIADIVRMIDFGEMPEVPPDTVSWRTLGKFCEWYETHCKTTIHPETAFSCALGYGGTIDWRGEFKEDENSAPKFAIVDFKTQSTKPGSPIRVYNDWAAQLAAYAMGINSPSALLINVVISTTEHGRIEHHEWTEGVEYWYAAFEKAFALWRSPLCRNFDPRQ